MFIQFVALSDEHIGLPGVTYKQKGAVTGKVCFYKSVYFVRKVAFQCGILYMSEISPPTCSIFSFTSFLAALKSVRWFHGR